MQTNAAKSMPAAAMIAMPDPNRRPKSGLEGRRASGSNSKPEISSMRASRRGGGAGSDGRSESNCSRRIDASLAFRFRIPGLPFSHSAESRLETPGSCGTFRSSLSSYRPPATGPGLAYSSGHVPRAGQTPRAPPQPCGGFGTGPAGPRLPDALARGRRSGDGRGRGGHPVLSCLRRCSVTGGAAGGPSALSGAARI